MWNGVIEGRIARFTNTNNSTLPSNEFITHTTLSTAQDTTCTSNEVPRAHAQVTIRYGTLM